MPVRREIPPAPPTTTWPATPSAGVFPAPTTASAAAGAPAALTTRPDRSRLSSLRAGSQLRAKRHLSWRPGQIEHERVGPGDESVRWIHGPRTYATRSEERRVGKECRS